MTHSIYPGTSIGTVHLKVADLERSIPFYRDVIGLKVLRQEADVAELTADGKRPLLTLRQIAGGLAMPKRSTSGLYHFAILVPDRRSLGLSLRRLVEHRIRIGSSDHLVSEALYLDDPDGNGIEIYADRPRDEWKHLPNGDIAMAVDPLDLDDLLMQAGDLPWTGLHPDTTIGHIHLHVSDLNRTWKFYGGVLGFDLVARMGNAALFVSAGGYHHHIGLNVWAGVGAPTPPDHAVGLSYYDVVIPDRQELEATINRVRSTGIPVQEHDGGWMLKDPSGIGIRLTAGE
ncbi:VOC family protein [Paenibacillus oceani]|uniref:VOC family protein n=1 Tax=Paenibacillus oceani TaxID=2772510 RepID=A0A927GYJ9_9BACL|nr:VOC family protein [Paenibacillus oceani]MBD2861680.1 VOC family protein [Paenibacillus oceani]